MAERKFEILNEDGRITIWDDVITAIARFATEKVPGATRPLRSGGAGIMGLFGGEDLSPNIKTELGENGVRVELRIVVEYGYPLHEVAQGVQAHVQADVEEMTGIAVTGVDVYVKKVVPPQVARQTEND